MPIITNHLTATPKYLLERYARRMTIEQRLAQAIRSFHLDALSSSVPLNVDLDVVLSVLAHSICAALARRLPGYHTATPDTLQRRFLQTGGLILKTNDTITVRLDRRAYSPVLRSADLPDTTVPWWGGRRLHLEYAQSRAEFAARKSALKKPNTDGSFPFCTRAPRLPFSRTGHLRESPQTAHVGGGTRAAGRPTRCF